MINNIVKQGFPTPPKDFYKVLINSCTYNQAPYIEICLNSVAIQQTNFPFVHYVIDDCSTDGEQDVLKSYLERECDMENAELFDNNICSITIATNKSNPNCTLVVYFLKKNMYGNPQKSELFTPWRKVCPYEALCEGDDYWIDPQKLHKQVAFLDAHADYTLCGSNGLVLWDNGVSYPTYFNRIFESRQLKPSEIIGGWPLPTASIIHRVEVLDDYPDWTKKIYSGDQTLLLMSLSKGNIYCISDITTVYRRNDNPYSATSILAKQKRTYMLEQHKFMYTHYLELTGDKFKTEITQCLRDLNTMIMYCALLDKSAIFAFLRMPKFFIVMLIKSYKHPLLQYLYNGKKIL